MSQLDNILNLIKDIDISSYEIAVKELAYLRQDLAIAYVEIKRLKEIVTNDYPWNKSVRENNNV